MNINQLHFFPFSVSQGIIGFMKHAEKQKQKQKVRNEIEMAKSAITEIAMSFVLSVSVCYYDKRGRKKKT